MIENERVEALFEPFAGMQVPRKALGYTSTDAAWEDSGIAVNEALTRAFVDQESTTLTVGIEFFEAVGARISELAEIVRQNALLAEDEV